MASRAVGRRCEWPVTDSIPIGRDWASGQYVARLSSRSGDRTARSPSSLSSSALRSTSAPTSSSRCRSPPRRPTTTGAGRASTRRTAPTRGRPCGSRFDRPFPTWHEANLNARWPFVWDLQLSRFLEREGYDVAYTTDLDTHREPWRLLGHPLVMTSGHDEYWSREMRDAFEAVRESGASLACMGANTCYWQARFEDDERTMVRVPSAARPTPSRIAALKTQLLPRPRPAAPRVSSVGRPVPGRDAPRRQPAARLRADRILSRRPVARGHRLRASRRRSRGWSATSGTPCKRALSRPTRPSSSTTRASPQTPMRCATGLRPGASSLPPARCSSAGDSTTGPGPAMPTSGCSGSCAMRSTR